MATREAFCLKFPTGKEPARSLQRRCDRGQHHRQGVGIESAARRRTGRLERTAAGFLELRFEFYPRRHLLEQLVNKKRQASSQPV